jgi:hypothetical protein
MTQFNPTHVYARHGPTWALLDDSAEYLNKMFNMNKVNLQDGEAFIPTKIPGEVGEYATNCIEKVTKLPKDKKWAEIKFRVLDLEIRDARVGRAEFGQQNGGASEAKACAKS